MKSTPISFLSSVSGLLAAGRLGGCLGERGGARVAGPWGKGAPAVARVRRWQGDSLAACEKRMQADSSMCRTSLTRAAVPFLLRQSKPWRCCFSMTSPPAS